MPMYPWSGDTSGIAVVTRCTYVAPAAISTPGPPWVSAPHSGVSLPRNCPQEPPQSALTWSSLPVPLVIDTVMPTGAPAG